MAIIFPNIILLILSIIPELKNKLPKQESSNIFLKENYTLIRNLQEIPIEFIFKLLKEYPTAIKEFLPYMKDKIKNTTRKLFLSEEDGAFIDNIIDDLAQNVSILDPLINAIKNNNSVIDYFEKIVKIQNDLSIGADNKTNLTFIELQKVLNLHEYFIDTLLNLTKIYPDLFCFFRIMKKTLNETNLNVTSLIKLFKDNRDIMIPFMKNVLRNYGNLDKTLETFGDFFENHPDQGKDLLYFLANSSKIFMNFIFTMKGGDNLAFDCLYYLINETNRTTLKDLLYTLCGNYSLLTEFGRILKHFTSIEKFIFDLMNFAITNEELTRVTHRVIKGFLKYYFEHKNLDNKSSSSIFFIGAFLRNIISTYVSKSKDQFKEQISAGCIHFLNYTLFGNVNDSYYMEKLREKENQSLPYDRNMSFYYIYKIVVDTSKSNNDIVNYENCLYNLPYFNGISASTLGYMDNYPTFVISVMDLLNTSLPKNNTLLFTYRYMFGTCLPQGLTNKSQNGQNYYCNKKDYSFIMTKIMQIFIGQQNIDLHSIEITKTNDSSFNFGEGLILFLILFPLLLNLFLIIYKKCILERKENISSTKDILRPKWFTFSYYFFNFNKNLNELFDFDSDNEQKIIINNHKGMLYIKGIIGLSLLFSILGQLFFVFVNLDMKDFGAYHFYSLLKSTSYILIFIGLRYSPRLIFSCSGFSLTYKLLSFYDLGIKYSSIKFFFMQFYKYIMLLLVILFFRYSFYPFLSMFDIKPMWNVFNELELIKPSELGTFFLKLLTLDHFKAIYKFFFTNSNSLTHDLFDYYWIPFNEIFFFVFGVILITIGVKTKIKFDYIILLLIIIMFILKILTYFVFYLTKDIYTTFYFSVYRHGRLMINPLYNLNYFLIGMYFGLINYSLQKGLVKIKNKKNKLIRFDTMVDPTFSIEDDVTVANNRLTDYNPAEDEDEEETFKKTNSMKKYKPLLEINDEIEIKKGQRLSLNNLRVTSISPEPVQQNFINESKGENDDLMPYLISVQKIIDWHKKDEERIIENDREVAIINNLYNNEIGENEEKNKKEKKPSRIKRKLTFKFVIILFFMLLLINFFLWLNRIFIYYNDKKIEEKKTNGDKENTYTESDKQGEKLLLEHFVTNPFLNFIYMIDIEIVIFIIQWALFILYIKGQYFIINFFNYDFWSFFTKSYFSLSIVCNSCILFIFYESETVVKLKTSNIILYYFINLFFIIIFTILTYILIELPLKKITKYLFSSSANITLEKLEKLEQDKLLLKLRQSIVPN